MQATVLEDNKTYIILDEIKNETNDYFYLIEKDNEKNFIIRKKIRENEKEFFIGLSDKNEFQIALELYLKKNA